MVPISHDALQHFPECHGADTWGYPARSSRGGTCGGYPAGGYPARGDTQVGPSRPGQDRGYPAGGYPGRYPPARSGQGGTLLGGYPGYPPGGVPR